MHDPNLYTNLENEIVKFKFPFRYHIQSIYVIHYGLTDLENNQLVNI